jgi:hypothetical protein
MRPRRVEDGMSRKEKQISCIVLISLNGEVLMPLWAIHWTTIDDDVSDKGCRNGEDFMIPLNDTA